MVPFAGYEMPVFYESLIAEHKAVRGGSGAFDASHMGVLEIDGPQAHEGLQRLLSNDLDRIGPGRAQYELMTNEQGGIVDDLIVYRRGEESYLVIVNAANRAGDVRWLSERLPTGASLRDISEERALIAVQGPGRSRAWGSSRRLPSPSPRSSCSACPAPAPVPATRVRTVASWSVPPRAPASSGTRFSPPVSCPAVSAPATRSGSRLACRCTVRTSRPRPIRSRPGWAGPARSPKSSRESIGCARSRPRGRASAWSRS